MRLTEARTAIAALEAERDDASNRWAHCGEYPRARELAHPRQPFARRGTAQVADEEERRARARRASALDEEVRTLGTRGGDGNCHGSTVAEHDEELESLGTLAREHASARGVLISRNPR
jgi:hypothetical protein